MSEEDGKIRANAMEVFRLALKWDRRLTAKPFKASQIGDTKRYKEAQEQDGGSVSDDVAYPRASRLSRDC